MNRIDAFPRPDVLRFVVLAYAIAWLPAAPSLFGAPPLPLVALAPFAPAIAALWVVRRSPGERMQILGLGWRRGTLRVLPIALLWPIPVAVIAAGLGRLTGATNRGGLLPGSGPRDVALLALTSVAIAPVILGEELGWRGYLQPRLAPGRPLLAAVATGLIWGLWHTPQILAGDQPVADRTATLIALPISTITLSVLLGWLRNQTGNIWPGTLAHAANNALSVGLISHAFTTNSSNLPTRAVLPVLIAEAITVAAVAALLHPSDQRSHRVVRQLRDGGRVVHDGRHR